MEGSGETGRLSRAEKRASAATKPLVMLVMPRKKGREGEKERKEGTHPIEWATNITLTEGFWIACFVRAVVSNSVTCC